MKKLLAGVMLAAITLGAGCGTVPAASQPPAETVPLAPTSTPAAADNNWQTYRYEPHHFEFSYPAEWQFTSPAYASLGEKIVQIELPPEAAPNTNFIDAAFTVSAAYAGSLDDCLNTSALENTAGFTDTRTLNGIEWRGADETGAGAGNLYESKVYRTFHNSYCFEVKTTIHTGAIGNYPDGTVTEVNTEPLWLRLDTMLATFKFAS